MVENLVDIYGMDGSLVLNLWNYGGNLIETVSGDTGSTWLLSHPLSILDGHLWFINSGQQPIYVKSYAEHAGTANCDDHLWAHSCFLTAHA